MRWGFWMKWRVRGQLIGGLIMVANIVGIGVYTWLLYAYALIILQITAFIAVAAVLDILAWIGYTMATTPVEDIAYEKEGAMKSLEAYGEQSYRCI